MAQDDSSDLSTISSLSSVASEAEQEAPPPEPKRGPILRFLKRKPVLAIPVQSPPARKRSPSPARESVLADDPNIAFLVMFRSRFNDCFPKVTPTFGPQELEADIVDPTPGERADLFLCGLLGLLLNRKQDVKPGHYSRALEDAIATHRAQWSPSWGDKSPLAGGATFASLNPTERLQLLRMLVVWAMGSSESVRTFLAQKYKQNRHEDDLNQPLSVQPWGSDSDKRRYYLIHGLDDTAFRVYRESNPAGFNRTWMSVAGTIDELKALANKLETKDGGPKARQLSVKINAAMSRFETTEEKRKRREYRQTRKAQFKRPDPGFSIYEGRTRGKRVKYNFSDDEDDLTSDSTAHRSARNGGPTPAEPVTTLRGRQVRPPQRMAMMGTTNGAPGDIQEGGVIDVATNEPDVPVSSRGRPQRAAAARAPATNGVRPSAASDDELYEEDDEDDGRSRLGDGEEDADEHVPEEESDDADDDLDEGDTVAEDELMEQPRRSLVVKMKVPKTANNGRLAKKASSSHGGSTRPLTRSSAVTVPAPTVRPTSPMVVDGPSSPRLPHSPLAHRGCAEKLEDVVTEEADSLN